MGTMIQAFYDHRDDSFEWNAIDPNGFGAVTITKAMTIHLGSTEGGVLAGGNGVVVNAPTDVVVLRGLDIFGVNPPTNGIRFIAGAALHVQNCTDQPLQRH